MNRSFEHETLLTSVVFEPVLLDVAWDLPIGWSAHLLEDEVIVNDDLGAFFAFVLLSDRHTFEDRLWSALSVG